MLQEMQKSSYIDLAKNDKSSLFERDYQQILASLKAGQEAYISQVEKEKIDLEDYFTMWVHQAKLPIAAMKLLLEKLVVIQKEYIIAGDKQMAPLTRARLAKELGLHESTISRAVSGKTIQLPNRKIVPLSIFFDRSLSLRTIIKEMIEKEDSPLTDTEIKDKLEEEGISIARRTVAKYRSLEGILPAQLRSNTPNSTG